MRDTERRSHSMLSKHWAVIDAIAKRLQATATTGSRVGLPSWRSLLYQIATGRLLVVRPTLISDAIKALNRLPVEPSLVGRKRRILATLRALKPNSSDG